MALPTVILLLKQVRAYYVRLESGVHDPTPLNVNELVPPFVLVASRSGAKLLIGRSLWGRHFPPRLLGVHLVLNSPVLGFEHFEVRRV